MRTVVISQPMFFPWIGMLEQIRLADVYVHYDDVQFSKGSFTNRVQIKTAKGSKWLTIPIAVKLGESINQVRVTTEDNWRQAHLSFLVQAFDGAPFAKEALALVERVYQRPSERLDEIVVDSMNAVLEYFEIGKELEVHRSSELGIGGTSWPRVLEIVKRLGGDVYVTGHGARDYLDHEAFERAGVSVEYIDYRKTPYSQLHGEFTPFVSVLDLIANRGRSGRELIASGTKPWREFISGS